MEADWDELQQISVPPPSAHDLPTPASTLAFDNSEELLWVGNEYVSWSEGVFGERRALLIDGKGRITSFYGPELRRYTSITAHPAQDGPVKQLLFHEKGIISIAPTSVNLCSRRGLTQWHTRDESMRDLRCMSFLGKAHNYILAAGCQDVMFKIDVEKGRIIEKIQTDYEYTMMKFSHYICAATSTGSVNVLDADSLRIVKSLTTNNVGICDMDARNNYLVTCGWINRPQGTPMLSGLANVYDLRAMVQLPPIPFHAGAAHIQMHPKMSTTCILASQGGQLQVVDLMNANTVNLRQANVSTYTSGLVLAPSGEALAIADADGFIHLWGSPAGLRFAEFSNPTDWGDTAGQVPSIDVDDDVPLSTIGMPYYREQLLSAWPSYQLYEVGRPPVKIDPSILTNLRANTVGMWAPNPFEKAKPRNLAEKTRLIEANGSTLAAPKFLSEKARELDNDLSIEQCASDIQEAMMDMALSGSTKGDVPVMYRNVEIKYSKFGVDDFDFEYYNKTKYSGLETHIANSYTNPLLQLFKFTPLVRNLALHHTATACLNDACLLCELGFLFDTLEKAEGQSCQATNLLKTFSGIPEAGRLSLLEEHCQSGSLTEMMQAACRFMLAQMSLDHRRIAGNAHGFEQVFAVDALASIRCVHCHHETIRPGGTLVTEMIYQSTNPNNRIRTQVPTFSQVLKASIELQVQTRGWCDKCRRYQQLSTRKALRNVPDVFMVNTAIKSADARRYWSTPGWLPDRVGVIVENGKLFCFEGEDLRLHLQRRMHVVKVYDLIGFVADIHSGEQQKSHLVSVINVALSEREHTDTASWHLFNDFLVRKLTTEDALFFATSWKMPSVLVLQESTARHAVDDTWKDNLDTTILYRNFSINNRPAQHCRTLGPLSEAPGSGTHVAIDTEFVALQQEEIEIKADGEREIIRPTRLGLARVSVLRGSGPDEGIPFINDYITMGEPIVDYLTKWSGVQEGDLDPRFSTHNLVPLKVAYKKLWLLVNLGCIFVGHGLPKDFRTINIHVPKWQVLDTVDMFYIRARQRKLSLRYLAWYILKQDIQQDNHDSIEDARTALRLWRKYEEFRDAGIVETMVEEVYREGKKWGYKPPSEAQALLKRRSEPAADGSLAVPSASEGRETPEMLNGQSAPVTPAGRRTGRGTDYFESPLR